MKPPQSVKLEYPLARLTTIKTGGHAQFFAAVVSDEKLVALLQWAVREDLPVGVIGSGSNLLVADQGVRGLVLKLRADLAQISVADDHLLAGGGARLPKVAATAAAEGLRGLEFGINIPGSVGGAVRMNANAYGGDLGKVLEWADVASSAGVERRSPAQFEFRYRSSNLGRGEVVSRAAFHLERGDPDQVKAAMAKMRSTRKRAQPSGIKTFGSTFKNPSDERAEGRSAGQLLDQAGCRGLRVGGACFNDKHANFVENTGEATTSDVLELMAEGRRRVQESFGVALEAEVQILGRVDVPAGLWGQDVSSS